MYPVVTIWPFPWLRTERVALHIHNFRKYDTVGLPRVKTGEFLTY